jgi:hypothetical protein
MGINFFFTFPTSEGSDLLSSHVMQTPTFISKLSDGNVIFRLDVGKSHFHIIPGIESVENRTCSVGNSVVIFLHFKKNAFMIINKQIFR